MSVVLCYYIQEKPESPGENQPRVGGKPDGWFSVREYSSLM